jgi:hypothetical protein
MSDNVSTYNDGVESQITGLGPSAKEFKRETKKQVIRT